jgi:hypothetical protein
LSLFSARLIESGCGTNEVNKKSNTKQFVNNQGGRRAAMDVIIHDAPDDLAATMNDWRASVPVAVPYALPTGAADTATTAVLAAMAHWPAEHAKMAVDRARAASALHAAVSATTAILTAADDDGAAGITKEAS